MVQSTQQSTFGLPTSGVEWKRTSCAALGRSGESIPTGSISKGSEDSEERQRGAGQRPNTSHARWAGTVKGKAQCRAMLRESRCLNRFPQDIMH